MDGKIIEQKFDNKILNFYYVKKKKLSKYV